MVTSDDVSELTAIPLFQDLPPEDLDRVVQLLHRRTVPADTMLMLADDPGEVAYIIRSGTVKIFLDREDGTTTLLALRGPGEIIGEMSIIEQDGRSASVVTLERCALLSWDRTSLERSLRTMPALCYNLARVLARRLRLATVQVQALATLDLPGRVARQILAFAEEYGTPDQHGSIAIPVRLTQTDLASMVGASRVRVNEVVVNFKDRGFIEVDSRQRITVHDAAALRRFCR